MNIQPRFLLQASRILSMLFSPHYIVVYAFAIVLCVTHLSLLPMLFRSVVLVIVWLFTVFVPHVFLKMYYRWTKVDKEEREAKKNTLLAYTFTLTSYIALLYLLVKLQSSFLLVSVILSACTTALVAMLFNFFCRINAYALATAGAVGLLMSLSLVYNFEVTLWICLLVLCCGLVSTSQLILRRNKLGEIGASVAIGFILPIVSIVWL